MTKPLKISVLKRQVKKWDEASQITICPRNASFGHIQAQLGQDFRPLVFLRFAPRRFLNINADFEESRTRFDPVAV
ncbi:MAG TPA: hypothetical protein DIT58_12015 [Porticoccaceae bacterium]|nr:hypothetical protein [Porticoccaceae bacterium]